MEVTYRLRIATGIVILRERRKRGMTQQALADHAGLQRVYVVGIEGGKRSVSLASVFALAQALGLSPVELVKKIQQELTRFPEKN